MPRRHQVAARLGIRLPPELETDRRPWQTVVMSRLGRNLLARQRELAMLFRFAEQAISHRQAVLAVPGTAAHRWLKRSCELLAGPLIEAELVAAAADDAPAAGTVADRQQPLSRVWQIPQAAAPTGPLTRDALAVLLADRVDAVWVRPGGIVHGLLLQRLAEAPTAAVSVLVPPPGAERATAGSPVIAELLAAGAVGYCCPEPQPGSESAAHGSGSEVPQAESDSAALASLLQAPHRWLIHCTRAPQGPWPGQSEQQFCDGLLLAAPRAAEPTPLTTLQRILTQRKLVGTSRTIAGQQPVVCFSASPLLEVVGRRRFRPHLGRWDAEPYGLAIAVDAARRLGAQPVLYHDGPAQAAPGPPEERWRRQARGRTFDWTAEHEWRLPGIADLRLLHRSEIVVFVDDDAEIERLPPTPWPVVSIQSLRRISGKGVATGRSLR